jgi:hypothetical protein
MNDENVKKVGEIEFVVGDAIGPDKLNSLGKILQSSTGDGMAIILLVGGPTNKMNEVVVCGPVAGHPQAASVLEFLAKQLREGLPKGNQVSPHAGN